MGCCGQIGILLKAAKSSRAAAEHRIVTESKSSDAGKFSRPMNSRSAASGPSGTGAGVAGSVSATIARKELSSAFRFHF
jgi:hypothetical protein